MTRSMTGSLVAVDRSARASRREGASQVTPRICPTCGRSLSAIRHGSRVFCSIPCRLSASRERVNARQRAKRTGLNAPRPVRKTTPEDIDAALMRARQGI